MSAKFCWKRAFQSTKVWDLSLKCSRLCTKCDRSIVCKNLDVTVYTVQKPRSEHQWRQHVCARYILSNFVQKRKIRPKRSTIILGLIAFFFLLRKSFSSKLCQHKCVTFSYLLTKFEENLHKKSSEFFLPHIATVSGMGGGVYFILIYKIREESVQVARNY